jgi:SpoIIAA-like
MGENIMAIQLSEQNGGKLLEVRVSGKLAHQDYEQFVPEFERLVKQHGKIRILFEMTDFHGWQAAALWDDIKFDMKHFADIERLAMVGEKKWEKGMSVFCKPFTTAKIRYFDRAQIAEARAWVAES